MQIYCKNCTQYTGNTFPKKLVYSHFKKYHKEKAKRAIRLTERTFIHEMEDKYDLRSKVKVYLQFFTD